MVEKYFDLLQDIFSIIDDCLVRKGYEYIAFELIHQRYEEFGMTTRSITVSDSVKCHSDISIDSPEFGFKLDELYEQMKSKGENWKSFTLRFSEGKVTTHFSYDDNPPPW